MHSEEVAVYFFIACMAGMVILAYAVLAKRRRRMQAEMGPMAYEDPKRKIFKEEKGFLDGAVATFGCGHPSRVLLVNRAGLILRQVHSHDAKNVPCHACYANGAPRRYDQKAGNDQPVNY